MVTFTTEVRYRIEGCYEVSELVGVYASAAEATDKALALPFRPESESYEWWPLDIVVKRWDGDQHWALWTHAVTDEEAMSWYRGEAHPA